MKIKKVITLGLAAGAAVTAFFVTAFPNKNTERTPKIEWRNFSDGMNLCRETNKKLLVDVYTDWCAWCKTMDRETYGEGEIISYISDHFVPVRLNAESREVRQVDTLRLTDAQLADAFGVTAYPTTIFFRSDGRQITSVTGYIEKEEFKNILHYIAEDAYLNMDYDRYKGSGK